MHENGVNLDYRFRASDLIYQGENGTIIIHLLMKSGDWFPDLF